MEIRNPKDEEIFRIISELSLGMTFEFIPWSQSRNKNEKDPSLNWKISLWKEDIKQLILTTDYMAGMGHCPAYEQIRKTNPFGKMYEDDMTLIKWECEKGLKGKFLNDIVVKYAHGIKIEPHIADVLYSLLMDASAINYSSFEDWCSEYGENTDSRKAEKMYHDCLEIGLKLRNGLGEDGLAKLQRVFQDY